MWFGGSSSSEEEKNKKVADPLEIGLNEEDRKEVEGSEEEEMAPIVGKIEFFQEGDNIEEWLERFTAFLSVNKVPETEKINWLTIYGGKVIFKLLKIVCAPKKVAEVPFSDASSEIISLIKAGSMAEVSKQAFYSRVQQPGESVAEFALALKELASECDFGTHLDTSLTDRFVYNLADKAVKAATIKAKKTSFEEAVKEALLHESQSSSHPISVHRFHSGVKQALRSK